MTDGQESVATGTTAKLGKQQALLRDQLAEQVDSAVTHALRRLRVFGRDVQALAADQDVVGIEGVQDAKDEFRAFIESAIDAAQKLDRLAPGYRPDATAALDAFYTEYEVTCGQVRAAVNAAKRVAAQAAAQAAQQQGENANAGAGGGGAAAGGAGAAADGAGARRVNTTLKPEALQADATYTEFLDWRQKWEDFCEASEMAMMTVGNQEAYLRGCLSHGIKHIVK